VIILKGLQWPCSYNPLGAYHAVISNNQMMSATKQTLTIQQTMYKMQSMLIPELYIESAVEFSPIVDKLKESMPYPASFLGLIGSP